MAKRTVARAVVARKKEPENARVIDDVPATQHEWTLGEAAFQLGIHRVTLLRMHQRGYIPPARWRRKPIPRRVYNALEIQFIREKIEADKAKKEAGRNYVEETNEGVTA